MRGRCNIRRKRKYDKEMKKRYRRENSKEQNEKSREKLN